ncbi:MAG: MAPEG family protein [Pseudomonadota bacterium]
MALPITALYAGPLALLILYLAFSVVGMRRKGKVILGDGGNKLLECRIRGHANACETIPIALILLGLSEGMGAPAWVLHILGLMLLIGRVMHGIHFQQIRGGITLRFYGMILTILAIALMAISVFTHALLGIG